MRLPAAFMALALMSSGAWAGQTFLSDDFESAPQTDYYWARFCSAKGHLTGAASYPALGQAVRPGACVRVTRQHNSFIRFTTQPFDIRSPCCGADFLKGSGGAELGPPYDRAVYPDGLTERGWDVDGKTYQSPAGTVRYEWDFRINDLSMLEAGLVRHAAIGQFHSQNREPCGESSVNSSPSPGLDVTLIGADQVKLSVYIKPIYNRLPPSLHADQSCAATPDQPCQIVLWRGTYALKDVLGQWMHIAFTLRFAPDSQGSLAVSFGRKLGTAPGDLAYQPRIQPLSVPMTVNSCPYIVHLGTYAQGYSSDYYGTTGPDGERALNGPAWVTDRFKAEYGRFIAGGQAPGEHPPQIVVDFDNFKVSAP